MMKSTTTIATMMNSAVGNDAAAAIGIATEVLDSVITAIAAMKMVMTFVPRMQAQKCRIICLGEECMGARQHGCRMMERRQKAGAWTASVRVRAKQLRLLTVNRSGSTVKR